jgi:hypothetical protein
MPTINTGFKGYSILRKVTNDGTFRPLDVNNQLVSVSGLPQEVKANVISDPNYVAPVLDLVACPIVQCDFPHYRTSVFETITPILTGVNPVKLINSNICLSIGYINLIPGDTLPLTGLAGFVAIYDSPTDTNFQSYRIYQIDVNGVIISILSATGEPF